MDIKVDIEIITKKLIYFYRNEYTSLITPIQQNGGTVDASKTEHQVDMLKRKRIIKIMKRTVAVAALLLLLLMLL